MNKDEILIKSREENKNQDIAEKSVGEKASFYAAIVGSLVCLVICFTQKILQDTVNWGCWVVDFSILSTLSVIKYVKLRKQRDLFLSIVDIMFVLLFLVGFIMSFWSA